MGPCLYEMRRLDWTMQAAGQSDDWLRKKLEVTEPSWDCGPRLWSIWRTVLKKEAAKRGITI